MTVSQLSPDERKLTQERLRQNNQMRRTTENPKSLSTITEEPKSLPMTHSKSSTKKSTVGSSTDDPNASAISLDKKPESNIPPAPPIPTRKPKHSSFVLKGSSREIFVPHEYQRPRTLSLQNRLITHIKTEGKPLFDTVLSEPATKAAPSILVTGFGLRNIASLQEALEAEEHLKLKQIYRTQEKGSITSSDGSKISISTVASSGSSAKKAGSTSETQTDGSLESKQKSRIKYLMGLGANGEEEASTADLDLAVLQPALEHTEAPMSDAMKRAAKYLRVHKIFEFYQFIIANLLSALPENPIEFIVDLLDQCLIYRVGLINPPLLYTKKHLECLFYLMDRMRTGFIELKQYQVGMRTVGMCLFNENPPTTKDGLVSKDYFIEEAYDCLSNALNDMIRRRWIQAVPPVTPPPPPTPQISSLITSSSVNEYPSTQVTRTRLFL